jgi:hypothetical protein
MFQIQENNPEYKNFLYWYDFFGPAYAHATRGQRKRMKKEWKAQQKENNMRYRDDYPAETANRVECSPTVNMTEVTPTDQKQRHFLETQMWDAYYTLQNKANKAFGLEDDASPATAKELVKRIQDGKFMLLPDDDREIWERPLKYIRWRDPALKEDQDGYKAWKENTLEPAKTKAERAIQIKTPEEGLAALEAFESTTIN